MGILGDLTVKLALNMGQFTAGLSNASTQMNNFANSTARNFQQMNAAAGTASNSLNVFSSGARSAFKDVTRIAQGIVVSQMFYKTVNSVQSATHAIAEFSQECEEASASFGLLMKDQTKADAFMDYLQDFAARTPYTMGQAIDNARKLLAYGFNPENMNPLLTTVSDAAAASGDSQTFDRVARALGQIKTKGKLAQQELLQLTEAGIPAFEILRDKLHLTSDELGKIGKLGISGDVAINALLKGMQERYGGAGKVISETMRGMLSTIKDDALIISQNMFTPMYNSIKGVVRKIRDAMEELKSTLRSGGIGGMMRSIIPEDALPKVQLFVANIRAIIGAFWQMGVALRPVIAAMGEFLLNAANLFLPIIQAMTQILAFFITVLTSNSQAVRSFVGALMGIFVAAICTSLLLNLGAALRSLFIVKVVTQLIVGLAKAISILSIAIIRNPWIALLGIAAGGFLALAMSSKTVSGALGALGNKISSVFGADPSKVFTPKMKENTAQTDNFNKSIGVSKDKLDDMGDAAKKAGKKAQDMLMSFDEVFNIKNPDDGADGSGIDAGALNDLGDVGGGAIPPIEIPEPEMPETDNLIQGWVDDFKNNLLTNLRNALIGAGIGALIGSVIGGLLGGPEGAIMGAKILGLAGAIAGYFWNSLPQAMKDGILNAGIGTLIGGTVGAILGSLLGVPALGTGLGMIVGALVGFFWKQFPENIRKMVEGAGIGSALGLVIGALFGVPALGMVLGGAAGALVGYFWDSMTLNVKESIQGVGIGAILGGIIGACFGVPVLGAAIGAAVGGLVGYFWENLKTMFGSTASNFVAEIQQVWGQVINQFQQAFSGQDQSWLEIGGHILMGILAGLAAAIYTVADAAYQFVFKPIFDAICNVFGIHSPATSMYPVGQYLLEGIWEGIKQTAGWLIQSIAQFGADVIAGFASWCDGMGTDLENWSKTTGAEFDTWWSNTTSGFSTWATNTGASISQWWADTTKGFTDWKSSTVQGISQWANDTTKNIGSWATDSMKKLSDWWGDSRTKFGTWCSDTKKSFDGWTSDTLKGVGDWIKDSSDKFTTWWNDGKKGFGEWATDTYKTFSSWDSDSWGKIQTWASNTAGKFSSWWQDGKQGFSTWSSETYSKIQSWAGDATSKLVTFASDTASKLSTWWDDSKKGFSTWYTDTSKNVADWYTDNTKKIADWATDSYKSISGWWDDTKRGFGDWAKDCFSSVSDWFGQITTKIGKAIDKAKEFARAKVSSGGSSDDDDGYDGGSGSSWDGFDVSPFAFDGPTGGSLMSSFSGFGGLAGHATGGIFNKEHIARFAEGNKAEAIIPLQNPGAMQPFVDAVSNGLQQSLGGFLATVAGSNNSGGSDDRQIMYVGTLIADDASLKELERRMRVVTIQENQRRGTTN